MSEVSMTPSAMAETLKTLARDIGTVSTVLDRVAPQTHDDRQQRRTLRDWRQRVLAVADCLDRLQADLLAGAVIPQPINAEEEIARPSAAAETTKKEGTRFASSR